MIWHYCRGSDTRKVERVQERALRTIYCDWNTSYKQLLEWAKYPNKVLCLVFELLLLGTEEYGTKHERTK